MSIFLHLMFCLYEECFPPAESVNFHVPNVQGNEI